MYNVYCRTIPTMHVYCILNIYIYIYTYDKVVHGFIDLFFAWVMKKKYDNNNNKIKYSHGTYKQDRYGKKTVIFSSWFYPSSR